MTYRVRRVDNICCALSKLIDISWWIDFLHEGDDSSEGNEDIRDGRVSLFSYAIESIKYVPYTYSSDVTDMWRVYAGD